MPLAAAFAKAPIPFVIVSVLLAITSALHLAACLGESARLRRITKPLLMPLTALLHISVCGFAHPPVIVALVFGCIGDVLLMRITQNRSNFLLGMLSFLIGHVMYIAAAFAAGLPQKTMAGGSGTAMIAACIAVMLLGGFSVYAFLRGHIYKKLRAPCAVYIFVLTAMAFTMIFCCLGGFCTATLLSAVGGVLFMVSDFILSCKLFGVIKGRHMNFAVMLTYISAQVCLALGFAIVK